MPQPTQQIITEIILRWPEKNEPIAQGSLQKLGDYLAEKCILVDFASAGGIQSIVDVKTEADRVTIEFLDKKDSWLWRAVFQIVDEQTYSPELCTFLCPVCYGGALTDGDVCLGCGGAGWGAS